MGLAGKSVLFRFADDDTGMRNVAVAALRQIGFPGQQVAAALGLTENYVATLHQRALREGTAGLVRPRGRPGTLEPSQWDPAREWRAAGVRDAEIARRLGVQQSTVLRRLGPAPVQGELALEDAAASRPGGGPGGEAGQEPPRPDRKPCRGTTGRRPSRRSPRCGRSRVPAARGSGRGRRRAAEGSGVFSRYAGAMLLHAYPGQAGEHPGRRGGRRRAGGGAAVGGEHVLRAGGGDGRAGQAPGPGRGRAAGRPGRAAVAADAAAPAGRDRRCR